MSINASIVWLRITTSSLCPFCSSYLQQKTSSCQVSAFLSQFSALKILKKKHGMVSFYPLASDFLKLTLDAFADASHSDDSSQICSIIGIIFGNTKKGAVFHVL